MLFGSYIENMDPSTLNTGYQLGFMLGKVYSNMAGACWFLKRPQDGIRHLEKAISIVESERADLFLGKPDA